jgi:hypothetical protein
MLTGRPGVPEHRLDQAAIGGHPPSDRRDLIGAERRR